MKLCQKKKPAVFLDRDGTINVEVGYLNHEDLFELYPNAMDAMRLLCMHGFLLIIITNQAGIAKGFMDEYFVNWIHEKLIKNCAIEGVTITSIYVCPHDKDSSIEKYRVNCDCRKPKPGMILKAAQEWNIDLEKSFFIGDKYTDILTGINANVKSILVKTGYGAGLVKYRYDSLEDKPSFIAMDLLDAAMWILKNSCKKTQDCIENAPNI